MRVRVAAAAVAGTLALLTGVTCVCAAEAAAGVQPGIVEMMEDQAERLDDGEFQRLLDQVFQDTAGYVPEITWREMVRDLSGGRPGIDVLGIARGAGRYLFRETVANFRLLGKIIVLAVAIALMENLGSSLQGRGVSDLATAVCYLAMVVIAAGSFSYSMGVARALISDMTVMMKALLPTLIALVATSGGPVSAGVLHPVMIATVYGVSVVVTEYVLPLITLSAVLDVIGHVVKPFRLSGLASLLRQASLTGLGLSLAVFVGVVAVNRAAGGVADGVALRSAKFLSGTLVPVVGKMFSDAVEMVFASSFLLRSAVGLAGAAGVILAAVFPLCKIVSLVIIYRLAGALVQPAGADALSECLGGIAGSLTVVSVAAGSVAIMYVIAITALAVAAHPV